SRYLRIHTNVPLGLPICALTLRLYASQSVAAGSGCSSDAQHLLFSDLHELYFDRYTGDVTVAGAPVHVGNSTIHRGPASGDSCSTQYVDQDLTKLYDAAVRAGTSGRFRVRFFADSDTDQSNDPTQAISLVPEIYVSIQAP